MGARGPAPDPNALRRERPSDQATWTDLPSRRDGPAPPWPEYMGEPSAGSMRALIWTELWTMPQAVMWERQRRHIEVALYVDTLASIEAGPPSDVKNDPTPTLRSLALRQQDALALTSGSLTRHRWRIPAPGVVVKPASRRTARKHDPDRTSVSARFEVLEGGGEAS